MSYRTRDVASVLGLSPRAVRSWIYAGLLEPGRRADGREYRYSFRDLVLLRLGCQLTASNIPLAQASRALRALQDSLPAGEPLASVEVDALGDVVIVRDGEGVWDPESGQRYFAFTLPDAEPAAGDTARPVDAGVLRLDDWRPATPEPADGGPFLGLVGPDSDPDSAPSAVDPDALEWFERAVALEDHDAERAKAAYRRALLLDPGFADAHANLGRLLYDQGALKDAARHFGEAYAKDPTHATAAYNLGVVFEDLGNPDAAIQAYAEALAADERFAAAHFNLSRLYEARGDSTAALRHLSEYRRLNTE